jgi:hypothetical protein
MDFCATCVFRPRRQLEILRRVRRPIHRRLPHLRPVRQTRGVVTRIKSIQSADAAPLKSVVRSPLYPTMPSRAFPTRLEIWFSPRELKLLERVAKSEDESVTEWARHALLQLARSFKKSRRSMKARIDWQAIGAASGTPSISTDLRESNPVKKVISPDRPSPSRS